MQAMIQYFIQFPTALYFFVAILSLCIGSFLNVVILRTVAIMQQEWQQECQMLLDPAHPILDEEKLSLSHPASHCPKCHSPIRWYHNIPIVSWLLLRGKCHYCKCAISIRYPLIELLTMLCSLCVVAVFGPTLQMLAALFFTWMLITLTFIDFDSQLLPDRFTLILAAVGLAINTQFLFTSPSLAIWGYIIGFLCLWLVYYAFKLMTGKEGMGYGDFKLLAALGAWFGPFMLPLVILLSSLLGVMIGLILLKIRKENQAFAFGPYIAIAGWIALLWGEPIMKIYLGN